MIGGCLETKELIGVLISMHNISIFMLAELLYAFSVALLDCKAGKIIDVTYHRFVCPSYYVDFQQ